ncbi:MAG: ECF-type sigma factor [Planctomycetaceae bacterium]
MSDATRRFSAEGIDVGNSSEELLPLVYDELRRLAAARISQEKSGLTLEATALVHEAYLRLAQGEQTSRWANRGHFFAAAAEAMRRILIENARRKASVKQGGERKRAPLSSELTGEDPAGEWDWLALDEAITGLAGHDARKASLVNLRLFAGLSLEEAAEVLEISSATAKRDWIYARAWLFGRLAEGKSSKTSEE